MHTQELNLSDSFVSAQKDGDNIKLTKISGAQTTVGPFSGGGGGGGATSTTNYPTSALTTNGGGFSGTPPNRIDFTDPTGTGGWFTGGITNYYWGSEDVTSTFVRYTLFLKSNNQYVSPNRVYGATFEITTSGLILDVNDTSHTGGNASNNPDSFKINGGATVYTTATAVNAGDTIHLMNAGTNTATFVVPTELADKVSEPQTKLSSNAGAGGYSCSASSVNSGSTTSQPFEPFMAFEGNTSPAANTWVTAVGSYVGGGSYYGSNSIVTTTGTASGEYIILNMPQPNQNYVVVAQVVLTPNASPLCLLGLAIGCCSPCPPRTQTRMV